MEQLAWLAALAACGDQLAPVDGSLTSEPVPLHDEDGDHIPDVIDNCPTIAQATQVDSDGDGLGDICDVDLTSVNHRLLFDAFAPPDARWRTAGWRQSDDGDSIEPVAPGSEPFAMPALVIPSPSWYIGAVVAVPQPANDAISDVGVVGLDASDAVVLACTLVLTRATTSYHLSFAVAGMPAVTGIEFPANIEPRLLLTATPQTDGSVVSACTVHDIDRLVVTAASMPVHPGRVATDVARFRSVDIADEQ